MDAGQARDLVRLAELEAGWENLPPPPTAAATLADLRARQRAYEAFSTALAGYNRRYRPAYRPEVFRSNLKRLAPWCRGVRDLLAGVAADPQVACPAQLVAKAYRLAVRVGKDPDGPVHPPETVRAAVEAVDELVRWFDATAGTQHPWWNAGRNGMVK
jgi:hypothetical protein